MRTIYRCLSLQRSSVDLESFVFANLLNQCPWTKIARGLEIALLLTLNNPQRLPLLLGSVRHPTISAVFTINNLQLLTRLLEQTATMVRRLPMALAVHIVDVVEIMLGSMGGTFCNSTIGGGELRRD